MIQTVDHTFLAHKTHQVHRKSRCQAVAHHAHRKHALLIRTGLVTEKTLARHVHHPNGDTLGGKQFGALNERRDLRAGGDHHNFGLGRIKHHVTALGDLCGLLAAAGAQRRKALDVLTRQHQRNGPLLLDGQLPRHDGLITVGRAQHDHRTFIVVVSEVFHQADLGFMLDRLVRRTVLANAERVVRPDIDHVQAHQRRKTHCRFHVVREDEERAARRNHTPVQRHAVGHAGHRQFRDSSLKEFAAEVALREGLGLLEEAVRLVRVRKVRRSHDHVLDRLGEDAQHRSRCRARRHAGLHLDRLVVDFGQAPRKEHIQFAG